jgi:hypothetical protein
VAWYADGGLGGGVAGVMGIMITKTKPPRFWMRKFHARECLDMAGAVSLHSIAG